MSAEFIFIELGEGGGELIIFSKRPFSTSRESARWKKKKRKKAKTGCRKKKKKKAMSLFCGMVSGGIIIREKGRYRVETDKKRR